MNAGQARYAAEGVPYVNASAFRNDGARYRRQPGVRARDRHRFVRAGRAGRRGGPRPGALEELRAELGDTFTPVAADATDPVVAGLLLERHRPRTLVLNAGAAPLTRVIHQQTWETFGRNWDVDVKHAFNWTREALLLPLSPGSAVIAISSGAAVNGSPVSGGYAGAKATIRFIASYAAAESRRSALGIRFISVLPQLTPETGLGAAAVAAYAARQGVDVAAFLADRRPALTPEQVGVAVAGLVNGSGSGSGSGFGSGSGDDGDAYLLTAAGLSPAP